MSYGDSGAMAKREKKGRDKDERDGMGEWRARKRRGEGIRM